MPEDRELHNSVKPPKYVVIGNLLYFGTLILIYIVLFVICMVIRAQTRSSNYPEQPEDEFFVLSEPDSSSRIELFGNCAVIAGKFPENNMNQEDVSEQLNITSDQSVSFISNYRSELKLLYDSPITCDMTVSVKLDDVEVGSVSVKQGWSGAMDFGLTRGQVVVQAFKDGGNPGDEFDCFSNSVSVKFLNGTLDDLTVDEIECKHNICTNYGFYLIRKVPGAEECRAVSHQSIFPLPIFLIIFTVAIVPCIIHMIFILKPPFPCITLLRNKYAKLD
ncbi:MAG: hypothetical protein EZS28_013133 [Streblomastix strix]|uniref:Uncharacterized protein n=1 Tax=Streblomastix strix TaxID=222440 RepID=A0A5J4W8U9_9EUKA|nr:MAG: hypothetical protein EZS28_013133 [Streblomastix strix]